MILDNIPSFLDTIFNKLQEQNIDVSHYELDHLGHQASSDKDYDILKPQFLEFSELLNETIVGGRRVGIFKLYTPVIYKQYTIPAIELIAPKKDQQCPSALEHVEFVIDESFTDFMKRYPEITWDTTAINQPFFPMLKLKLGNNIQVKFHYEPVLEIVKKENNK